MICGVVDVGSNTIRLSIYRCEDETTQLLLHRKTMAGLASYVEEGIMSDDGIGVVCRVLKEYRQLLDNLRIKSMFVFATASLRNIANKREAVGAIRAETGIEIDVISGKEEAELSFCGAVRNMTHSSGLMLDLGGGSTELLWYENDRILSAYSMPVGSLNLFNRYVSEMHPNADEQDAIQNAVREQIRRNKIDIRPAAHICGVGGTVRAACKVANRLFKRQEDERVLTCEDLRQLLKRFKNMDRDTIRLLSKIVPERILTIVPGVLALDAVCQACGTQDITASVFGVREGFLYKRILEGGRA